MLDHITQPALRRDVHFEKVSVAAATHLGIFGNVQRLWWRSGALQAHLARDSSPLGDCGYLIPPDCP